MANFVEVLQERTIQNQKSFAEGKIPITQLYAEELEIASRIAVCNSLTAVIEAAPLGTDMKALMPHYKSMMALTSEAAKGLEKTSGFIDAFKASMKNVLLKNETTYKALCSDFGKKYLEKFHVDREAAKTPLFKKGRAA